MYLIKRLRAAQGWSQRDLARRVGCSGAHISDIENGKVLPSLRMLRRLALTLNVSEADLLMDLLPLPARTPPETTESSLRR